MGKDWVCILNAMENTAGLYQLKIILDSVNELCKGKS